jgi:hypothetical protein
MVAEPDSANEKRMWGGVRAFSRSPSRLSPNEHPELTCARSSLQGGTAVMIAEPSTDNEKRMWGGVSSLAWTGCERAAPRGPNLSRADHRPCSRLQGGTAVMVAEPEAANEKRMWGGVSLPARQVQVGIAEHELTSLPFTPTGRDCYHGRGGGCCR